MEGAEENREKFRLAVGMNGIPSDLLQKLMKRSYNQDGNEQEEDAGELELSLGLSMNGRFGVDPMRKKLKRSSSISNLVFAVGASSHQARAAELDTYAPLARTRSLPTEAEEEWHRHKEFQSMRRMEARKKRMEKLRNVRVQKDKESCVENGNGNGNGNGLHEIVSKNVCGQRIENPIFNKFENGNEISSSQGSIGSQRSGSGSSGMSDLDFEGGNQKPDVLPPRCPPSQDQSEQEPAKRDTKLPNESLKDAMFDMPYVSTKRDGPNGHKIEGFLYRYKKGEEVRIVCVCHGSFLTPAEFVKHGGGGDVEHPLKHIVVNPFPLL
ncbi:hypothetical protein C2S53_007502 [Perilla frutescens var. hirtella]|uniref:Ninja-family protein n=1 Tax=Perilla frutescens var. hirtella TaxID=608512 RepID=A0AAD4P8M7_PERFH|nr:hypothetical protein C2S53_007502 [Perilla frutescens var. hirtella]